MHGPDRVVVIVSGWVPSSIQPYIAMTFVMGMLFGPWGALGVDLVSLIRNTTVSYAEPSTLAMDLVMTFLVAYIPYRIWYSTSLGGDMRPPVLDSTRNMAKFFGVMVASGLLYMVMYNLMYGYIDGFVSLNIQDLAMFLNMVSFSLILGILSILVCRYLGIRFWTPSEVRASPLARIPGRVFDVCLVLGLIVPFAITELTGVEHLTAATVLAYAMAIVFCLKPVRPAVQAERPSDQGVQGQQVRRQHVRPHRHHIRHIRPPPGRDNHRGVRRGPAGGDPRDRIPHRGEHIHGGPDHR